MILIQGDVDNLIGLKIQTPNFLINSVEKSDTFKIKQQLTNEIDKNIRRSVSIKIPASVGITNLKIYRGGKIIYEKDLYLASGQIRKIQI